jgi:FkbM family methyltransferase
MVDSTSLIRNRDWVRSLIHIAGATRDPVRTFLRFAFRGRCLITLYDGYRFRMTAASVQSAATVVALAFHGAVFKDGEHVAQVHWEYDPATDILTTPSGIRVYAWSTSWMILTETFLYGTHFAGDDLKGKVIVDLGANAGDTALYFAQLGAQVYAFEPDPQNYSSLLKNLAINPALKDKIAVFNRAAGTDGKVVFKAGLGGSSSIFAKAGTSVTVDSSSLTSILRDNAISHPFLLKSDCKGSEFDLLSDAALGQFEHVAIEYDGSERGRYFDEIVTALRTHGFQHVRIIKHNEIPGLLSYHGLIHGWRGDPA